MLNRIVLLSVCALLALASCNRASEVKLVGWWRWKGCEDAGDIMYQKNRLFVSRQWAVMGTQQPPVVTETGEWHVRGNRLVMDYKGDTRPQEEKHVECPFVMFDDDTLLTRRADETIDTFKRVK